MTEIEQLRADLRGANTAIRVQDAIFTEAKLMLKELLKMREEIEERIFALIKEQHFGPESGELELTPPPPRRETNRNWRGDFAVELNDHFAHHDVLTVEEATVLMREDVNSDKAKHKVMQRLAKLGEDGKCGRYDVKWQAKPPQLNKKVDDYAADVAEWDPPDPKPEEKPPEKEYTVAPGDLQVGNGQTFKGADPTTGMPRMNFRRN